MSRNRETLAIGLTLLGAAIIVIVAGFRSNQPPQAYAESLTPPCVYLASGALPDPKCTPGAVNHAVTQATIRKTICVPGWTATVRPPVGVTEPEKRVSLRQYGYVFGTSLADYEYDHLIPLELGGATNDLRNLFPEPHHVRLTAGDEGSYAKDAVENRLHALVCDGKMKLAVARRIMRTDWRKAP